MGNQYNKRRRPVTQAGRLAGRPAGQKSRRGFCTPECFSNVFTEAGWPAGQLLHWAPPQEDSIGNCTETRVYRPPAPPARRSRPAGRPAFVFAFFAFQNVRGKSPKNKEMKKDGDSTPDTHPSRAPPTVLPFRPRA